MSLVWSATREHVDVRGLCKLALLLTWASWESWAWRHEGRRAEPTPSQLQCLEEQDLHTAEVVSEPTGDYDQSSKIGELVRLLNPPM